MSEAVQYAPPEQLTHSAAKGRFLICVWPFTGHVFPALSIAVALKNLGHEVALYSGEQSRSTIEREGFDFFPFKRVDEQAVDRIVLSDDGILGHLKNPVKTKKLWRQWVLDTVKDQDRDLDEIIDNWRPDVLVSDLSMWAPFLLTHERRNIPVAVLSVIPACHIAGRTGPILGFPDVSYDTSVQRCRSYLLRKMTAVFLRDVKRDANRLRIDSGLAPMPATVTDYAGSMPLYLMPSSPEFDNQREDLPPSVEYVGTCLWSKPPDTPEPQWLADRNPEVPLVYASEGTIHLDPKLLRAVAEGLRDQSVDVVMTTGKHRDPDELNLGSRPLGSNIRVERWADQNHLIPKMSALVTIGGPSTLMAALQEGIPVVIVPFAWDHPETARRIQKSGAGIYLDASQCSPENMRDAVLKILNEPSYRENAQRLASSFKRLGGAPAAGRLIANLLPTSTGLLSKTVRDECVS